MRLKPLYETNGFKMGFFRQKILQTALDIKVKHWNTTNLGEFSFNPCQWCSTDSSCPTVRSNSCEAAKMPRFLVLGSRNDFWVPEKTEEGRWYKMKLSFVPHENSEGFWSASLPKQTEKLLGRFFVVAIAQAATRNTWNENQWANLENSTTNTLSYFYINGVVSRP